MSADNSKRQVSDEISSQGRPLPKAEGQKGLFARALDRTTISVDIGDIVRAIGYAIAIVIAALNAPNVLVETIETVVEENPHLMSR